MRLSWLWVAVGLSLLGAGSALGQEPYGRLQAAVARSTLAQVGTKPFHLKATLAPTYVRAGDADRTGEIEFWWVSPTHYRREVRCASFHEVEIRDGSKVWQHNDGDYMPEWLREIARKLVEPVTPAELLRARTAEVKHMMGTTYYQWTELSSNGTVEKGMGASLDVADRNGLLRLDSEGKEGYQDFHGRMVARVVTAGWTEVKATVGTLEDLRGMADGFLDPTQPGGDTHLIETVEEDEGTLRRNLEPAAAPVWPALRDGPLEGILTTDLVVDRAGHPRDCERPISHNPGVSEAARDYICGLQFRPTVVHGEAVQVVSRFTMAFKTVRPAGAKHFDSAREYFEHGRKSGFPATGSTAYVLRAEFQTRSAWGAIVTGRYEDTFADAQHWRREAWFGKGHAVRSRNGEKRYLLEEGPESEIPQLVLRITEPIPALDTFVESDWRMKSVNEGGGRVVRVLSGYESPEGKLDAVQARGYWFDASGELIKTYLEGLETRRSDFQEFAGMQVARTVSVYSGGGVALKLTVKEMVATPPVVAKQFEVNGHEWVRQFTDQGR